MSVAIHSLSHDTIAALASASGRGGIGVIRISGPNTQVIAQRVLGAVPNPRMATFFVFKDEDKNPIDEGIAIFFPGPHSFTGEDVLELQGHGGVLVMDQLLRRVLQTGARIAKPGEFSERAFLNKKIDLIQAEAIADLIDASSDQAARSALRSLQGAFSNHIQTLQEELTTLRMMVEAAIDFPEEEIDFLAEQNIVERLKDLQHMTQNIQHTARQGSLLREGIHVVLAGKPNAGKSSLLNALAGRDVAIVTEIPGTTRDLLREFIHIDGIPLHIIDTAGLRHTQDIVEQEGLKRAWHEIERADLVLLVVDASLENTTSIAEQVTELRNKISKQKPMIIVKNKIDLTAEQPQIDTANEILIKLSAKHELGIDLLKTSLKQLMGCNTSQEGTFIARRRHLDAIARTQDCIHSGLQQLQQHRAGELLAEDLFQAQQALSEITGQFTSDDLLGKIFATFCIGK